MNKFTRIIVWSCVAFFCVHPLTLYAQDSASMSANAYAYQMAKSQSEKFTKKYKRGIRKRPEGFMVRFSKKELDALINSVPGADSVNFVFGTVKVDTPEKGIKKKPTVILQFYVKGDESIKTEPKYIYKLVPEGNLCPPPPAGCKVKLTPRDP